MGARGWAWWVALLAGVAGARELDPAACAARFDVQRDKIIRTEESREMGARYLSELDVGARHECLRLCCETDACDVFVYEEKGPGSCYLFNCGPPEDFRCKFTAHTNFSSGVLALSRRLAELQDQERLAHHEQELANLRSVTSSTASTTAATTPAPAPPPRPTPTLDIGRQTSHCSHYQFECRHGKECIAVYNACDGVAQCADGSDEAPELGCPPPQAPRAPPPPVAVPVQTSRTTPPPTAVLKPLQESVEPGGGGEGLVASDTGALSDRWPHRLAQAQPQHRYNDGASPHIFSHKGGLLQEPEGAVQFPPFEAPWPRRAWPAQSPPSGMDGISGERGWSGGGYPRVDWPEPDPRRAWPVPPPRSDQEIPVYIPPKTMPEIPIEYSSQQHTLRDSPKKGFELLTKDTSEPPPHIVNNDIDQREEVKPPPVQNTTKKKVVKDKTVQASKPSGDGVEKKPISMVTAHQHYATMDDHDGLSEHSPAAMMLLAIGMVLTTLMAVMLGCRVRAARRRQRRGKSPFAHDADYLVNGMYL
ncbi:unnamed protein product [Arctia plantaginis]|uniref:MANSC domain-containing protein n=1 Tax=Arctia plantaginis TaxID=874455 RepID=A0A8S0YWF0_ARCPL|nr:unnamed protein product [Arctia plantaginis]CAB3250875.1 unnamed protein product [Arctia plantaginis]